jgi:uncharacterized protein (DUF433 family)
VDTPIYTISESAHYLKLATATLRSWVIGRDYPKGSGSSFFRPLIQLPDKKQRFLSFNNLIESYVLQSLRQEHGVPIKAVRNALKYAESELKIERLLLNHDLLTTAGDLFLKRYGKLINLSRSGQLALRKVFESHLRRIEWHDRFPVRFYPYIQRDIKKIIAIDPEIKFGRPIIMRKGISTSIIVDRIDAGESIKEIAKDYDLIVDEVEMAVIYERAA